MAPHENEIKRKYHKFFRKAFVIKRFSFISFVCFIFTIFNVYTMGIYKDIPAPEGYKEREKLQFQIIDEVSQKLEKKYIMNSSAVGSSGDGCLLKSVCISFQRYQGAVSLEENREILFDCIQICRDAFNNNEKIRQYLFNYPFTENNIEITIHSYGKNNERLFHPEISCVSNYPKGISYYTNDPDIKYRHKQEIEETYQEAYAKLNKGKEKPPQECESI